MALFHHPTDRNINGAGELIEARNDKRVKVSILPRDGAVRLYKLPVNSLGPPADLNADYILIAQGVWFSESGSSCPANALWLAPDGAGPVDTYTEIAAPLVTP